MEALLHVLVHGWAEGLMTWREEEGRRKEEQEEEGRIERKTNIKIKKEKKME